MRAEFYVPCLGTETEGRMTECLHLSLTGTGFLQREVLQAAEDGSSASGPGDQDRCHSSAETPNHLPTPARILSSDGTLPCFGIMSTDVSGYNGQKPAWPMRASPAFLSPSTCSWCHHQRHGRQHHYSPPSPPAPGPWIPDWPGNF